MALVPKFKMQLPAALIFYSLVYFTSSFGYAKTYSPASAVGAGGTGRAAVGPGEAIFMNSAAIPHLVGRHLFFSGTNDVRVYAISDNTKESLLPGALSWISLDNKSDDSKSGILSLSLAEFVAGRLSFGLTGKYYELKTDSGTRYTQSNADLGMLWAITQSLGFGVVQSNLLSAPKNFPTAHKLKPQTSLGLTYVYQEFARFKVDWQTGEGHLGTKPEYGFGIETFFNEWSVFKIGRRIVQKDEKTYNSIGLGFHGPVFYVDWAYEVDASMSRNHAHFVDLGMPF